MQMLIAEPDGSIPNCENVPEGIRPDSLLPTIQEKLGEQNYSASEVQRLITAELVRLCLEIEAHQWNPKAGRVVRTFRTQFQALRALADSVRRTEALRKKADQIDFDGAKFQYVLDELLKCFDEVIQKTLGRNDAVTAMTVKTARGILGRLLEKREPDLRREVARMR